MEENKVLRAQLELAQVRQEIDRRVAEKEDEFNNTRKNHARAMDSLGASIEVEQRAKGEGLRVKNQLQGEIADSRSAVNNMQTINGRDMTSKRQLESSIHTMQAEVDGMLLAAK